MKIFDKKSIIILLLAITLFIAVYFFTRDVNTNSFVYNDLYIVNNSGSEISTIIVHVAGEVVNPGLVCIPYNSRISDAIDAAGGLTPNADLTNVNLAYIMRRWSKALHSKYI